jgi:stearoyl-CoA desaturase (delta-9 desaturase)
MSSHVLKYIKFHRRISPAENASVAFFSMGEGWHNYHHLFPMDYKAAELGRYSLNFTTMLLDFFHWIGWAYDMKEPSKELVHKIATRYGDGSLYSIQEAAE